MNGEIHIEIKGNLSFEALSKINKVMTMLNSYGIKITKHSSLEKEKRGLRIKVMNSSDITEKPIEEMLKILYPEKKIMASLFGKEDEIEREDLEVKLQQGTKEFRLPDQNIECTHWFIIEE